MQCKNHPDVAAATRCSGCAESFCENCVLELDGQTYCGACKVMALGGRTLVTERAAVPCKDATTALTCAIVGLIFFSFILEPIAIFIALKARKQIASNPQFTGSGKATAALIIGSVGLTLVVLGFVLQIASI